MGHYPSPWRRSRLRTALVHAAIRRAVMQFLVDHVHRLPLSIDKRIEVSTAIIQARACLCKGRFGPARADAFKRDQQCREIHRRAWANTREGGNKRRACCYEISDNGAGISADLLPRVFDSSRHQIIDGAAAHGRHGKRGALSMGYDKE
jgi:hypothetical protein